MHPLLLSFSHAPTEQEYRAYRLRAFFRELDTRFLAAQAALATAFFACVPLLFPSIPFHTANVLYPGICCLNRIVIWALPWRLYEQHRHVVQLLFRALVDWSVIQGIPAWAPSVPVRSYGTFLTHLVLNSGAGCLNWAALGWPLLLAHQLPYNVLASTAYAHALAPHACHVILQNDLGTAHVRTAWAVVSRIASLAARLRGLLVAAFAPDSAPGAAPLVALSEAAGDEGVCWSLVALTQLLVGCVLPTTLVFALEAGSREYFLRSVVGRGRGRRVGAGAGDTGGAGEEGAGAATVVGAGPGAGAGMRAAGGEVTTQAAGPGWEGLGVTTGPRFRGRTAEPSAVGASAAAMLGAGAVGRGGGDAVAPSRAASGPGPPSDPAQRASLGADGTADPGAGGRMGAGEQAPGPGPPSAGERGLWDVFGVLMWCAVCFLLGLGVLQVWELQAYLRFPGAHGQALTSVVDN
ncbi:hypothetical protein HYH03_001912 [Edaphochlamys debaryana]|uniref:Uncharacterized protein n=1 Tax=Edaphochlamys debaryana TaxID=47281 RepID=A0A836C4N0_9CHLO|nr:hypothetical protein HYH03_001912 [Edaphochlamys debaryana]|eukprot:KAG2500336.1 hypothetical protein HYH03_001912 [Edaphochlamys debaryana]